jgi:hypothetical protein
MNESFELDDEVVALRRAGLAVRPGAPTAARSIEVYTEGERERLAGRSSLGLGLAQVTSRLLDQLATGAVRAPQRGSATAGDPQQDMRGNRVPLDESPLVSWQRVVAVYPGGSLPALVSGPIPA